MISPEAIYVLGTGAYVALALAYIEIVVLKARMKRLEEDLQFHLQEIHQ